MRIKTKVAFGVVFLFGLIVTMGGLGLYYLKSLSAEAQNILIDNYESLDYAKHILENCDSLQHNPAYARQAIERNLLQQEDNVTEPGERALTLSLRTAFEKLKSSGVSDSTLTEIRQRALAIQDLNMKAIIRKNSETQHTADQASTYLIIIGTVCALAAFTFILNFPGYVANPIAQLTSSIKSIANKNYEERLHFDRKDEFEELAEAFNQMAEKLDEYEHSSLAKILFEKKRIETIINRMTDPVMGLDESNHVIFVNEQALGLLNLQRTQIMDQYAPDVALGNDLLHTLIRHNTAEKDNAQLIKVVVAGKENYYTRESIAIQTTPTGEKDRINIGKVILLKNVTSYKELDLAKTNFIATISHELKTPIASLQMCARLLLDQRVGTLNEEQHTIVHTFQDEVSRLTRITHELLDLSQVETGNIKLSVQSIPVQSVTHSAVEAVKFQAGQKRVVIDVQLSDEPMMLLADQDKTTWVLVNLLTNAIRYSPVDDRVIVACQRVGNSIKFSVSDHGPGIDAKYLGRIFEKFFQVPGTPSGTGLGLAISREFIEAQGGSVHVTSEAGKGSLFYFLLPASETRSYT